MNATQVPNPLTLAEITRADLAHDLIMTADQMREMAWARMTIPAQLPQRYAALLAAYEKATAAVLDLTRASRITEIMGG